MRGWIFCLALIVATGVNCIKEDEYPEEVRRIIDNPPRVHIDELKGIWDLRDDDDDDDNDDDGPGYQEVSPEEVEGYDVLMEEPTPEDDSETSEEHYYPDEDAPAEDYEIKYNLNENPALMEKFLVPENEPYHQTCPEDADLEADDRMFNDSFYPIDLSDEDAMCSDPLGCYRPSPSPSPYPGPGPNPGPEPYPGPSPSPGPGPSPGPEPYPGPSPSPGPGPIPKPTVQRHIIHSNVYHHKNINVNRQIHLHRNIHRYHNINVHHKVYYQHHRYVHRNVNIHHHIKVFHRRNIYQHYHIHHRYHVHHNYYTHNLVHFKHTFHRHNYYQTRHFYNRRNFYHRHVTYRVHPSTWSFTREICRNGECTYYVGRTLHMFGTIYHFNARLGIVYENRGYLVNFYVNGLYHHMFHKELTLYRNKRICYRLPNRCSRICVRFYRVNHSRHTACANMSGYVTKNNRKFYISAKLPCKNIP